MKDAAARSSLLLLTWLLSDVSTSIALSVTNVSASGEQTLYIKSDGSLWSTGYRWWHNPDGSGQGMGSSAPQQLVSNGVARCIAGIGHALFITSDNSLWGFGYNWSGQLGDGGANLYYYYSPRQIATGVKAAAAGNAHSLFVKTDGSLWAAGYNADGELGDGTTNVSYVAKQIVTNGVVAVAAGFSHSLFLKSDGSVWGMGANVFGQLGDGATNNCLRPKQIVESGAIAISAGEYHSLFLKSDGSLWATGLNELGQLGDGTNIDRFTPTQIVSHDVKVVAGGGRHTLFLQTDGSLWGMGYAHFGQLGNGATLFNVMTPKPILSNSIATIAAGGYHSLFVKEDGTLWGMGSDYDSELGGGLARGQRVFPVLVSPRLNFSASPKVGVTPLIVQFGSPSIDSESNAVVAWTWNFGDGAANANIQNPAHVYSTTNSNFLQNSPVFIPALTATNINGDVLFAPGPSVVLAGYTGLILNGGFETGDFFGWGTNVGSGYYQTTTASHSGKYTSMLNFSATSPVSLSQTLTTTPGVSYVVSFWVRNLRTQDIASNNVLRVSWDGNPMIDETNPVSSYLTWTPFQFVATASLTNTVLQFQFRCRAPYSSSVNLDDVVVLPQPVIEHFSFFGTNIVLAVTNGLAGWTYQALTSTNLVSPIDRWRKAAISNLNANGSFSLVITNVVNLDVPMGFYTLQVFLSPPTQGK